MTPLSNVATQDDVRATAVFSGQKNSICFLFAHEQAHQIPHSAPILNKICDLDPAVCVHAYVLGEENLGILKSLMTPLAIKLTRFTRLKAPLWARFVERAIGGAGPLSRIYALKAYAPDLDKMSVIVAPDVTSLMLRTKFGLKHAKLVYTQHGAGDRAVGFNPSIGQFDHVFIPGQKILDRMKEQKIVRDGHYSVIGYPKFDSVPFETGRRASLFETEKPIVLYNPHFDPSLSSWYEDGEAVLDYFAQQDKYNLIFAPHVMMFTRKLHVTSDLKIFKWRKKLSRLYTDHPKIHVDTGSVASINMTYTRNADIYLGDVSSQVYEFLSEPRPCLFLNIHHKAWQDNPNFNHWRLGDVITSVEDLGDALEMIETFPDRYKPLQMDAFSKTFGRNPMGASERAADILLSLLPEN